MLTTEGNIPITVKETSLSLCDVISLSIQNLIAFVSSHRPWWSEFLALSSIDLPTSFSSASSRVNLNFHHFAVNYSLVTTASVILFLIGDLTAFFTIVSFGIMWLLLYFCRDQPLVLYGQHVSDRVVIFVLFVGSLGALWFTHCLQRLALGVATGFMLCLVHSVIRNSDDLFVQEEEVVVLPSNFLHWS